MMLRTGREFEFYDADSYFIVAKEFFPELISYPGGDL
jgi:hypothetical protein